MWYLLVFMSSLVVSRGLIVRVRVMSEVGEGLVRLMRVSVMVGWIEWVWTNGVWRGWSNGVEGGSDCWDDSKSSWC
jgi:hypothetical protein